MKNSETPVIVHRGVNKAVKLHSVTEALSLLGAKEGEQLAPYFVNGVKAIWLAPHPENAEQPIVESKVELEKRRDYAALTGEPMLKHFRFAHLPEHLQEVPLAFCRVACWIVDTLPPGTERTEALRKLLESKDCAVRTRV